MTALSIIQSHCKKHALNVPTALMASTDTTVIQLLALLEEQLSELATQARYNTTTIEATFTMIADEDQGTIQSLATEGYLWALSETFFDRSLRRPLYGPVDETQWQQLKALPNPGPFYKFRIRGDHLLINPEPAAPLSTVAFEYASSYLVVDGVSGARKETITLDTDTFVFPEFILQRALSFRWKQVKGLAYQADETAFWNLLNDYIAKDKAKPRVNVGEPGIPEVQPGVFVPSGSWFQ